VLRALFFCCLLIAYYCKKVAFVKECVKGMGIRVQAKFYRGHDRKKLQAVLRDHGFRSTEGRLFLLAILKRTTRPLSVPDIAKEVGRNLDEVNVYRALEALCDAGVLSRSHALLGAARYEYPHSHHHHVICTDCGRTEDVEDCMDGNIEERVLKSSPAFASVKAHALEFFGTCKPCASS
jgi:Fe2+ or Zn2+ uptake regulation protein